MQPPSGRSGELRGLLTAAATEASERRSCRRSKRSDGARERRRKARAVNRLVSRRQHREALTTTPPSTVVGQARSRGGVWRRRATATAMRCQEVFGQRRVTRLASFNSRTLKKRWRQLELINVLEQKNIVACSIQEHRIGKEQGQTEEVTKRDISNGWMMVYTPADENGVGGVGFLLAPSAYKALDKVVSVSSRVLRIQFSTAGKQENQHKCHLVAAYAPTNEATDECKEQFYADLQSAVELIPRRDELYILADLNARLDVRYCPYPASDKATDNGDRLADFLDDTGMRSAMCHMRKPDGQWYTHTGPKGFKSRIDHCLCRNNQARNVLNCSLHSLSTPASDHRLLMIDTRLRLARPAKAKRNPARDLSALTTAVTQTAVENLFTEASPNTYAEFAATARKAVEMHAPLIVKPSRSKPWEDAEITKLRTQVKEAKQKLVSKPNKDMQKSYNDASLELAEAYSSKQAIFYSRVAKEVEDASVEGKTKAAYKAINRLTGRKSRPACGVEADSPADRVKVLQNHFENLLSAAPPTVNKPVEQIFEELPINSGPFTLTELKAAASTLQRGKALGVDEVPVEILQIEKVQEMLLPIINSFNTEEEAPHELLLARLVAIFKNKGSAKDANNYRGIALMSLVSKLFNKMLLLRIRPHLDPLLRENQNGFRPRRGTTQHVLALRRIFEQCRVKQKVRCVSTFIDFSKAFDSISRNMMRKILLAYGIPELVVNRVMYLYNGSKAHVSTPDGPSDEFEITAGVLQGDTLAPFLFVIVVDWVMRNAILEVGHGIGFPLQRKSNRPARGDTPVELTDLDFADDIALISDNMKNAQKLLSAVETWSLAVGLRINKKKTEYMRVGDFSNCRHPQLHVQAGEINEVTDFKYLGCWVANTAKDFTVRRALAFDAMEKLWRVWKSDIPQALKIRIFRACVEPVLLYGSETWTFTSYLTKRLNGCYTRMLRKARGWTYKDRKTLKQIYESLPKISEVIEKRQLAFAGHCARSTGTPQPVQHLVFWEAPAKFVRGQGATMTYIKMMKKRLGIEAVQMKRDAINREGHWKPSKRQTLNAAPV